MHESMRDQVKRQCSRRQEDLDYKDASVKGRYGYMLDPVKHNKLQPAVTAIEVNLTILTPDVDFASANSPQLPGFIQQKKQA